MIRQIWWLGGGFFTFKKQGRSRRMNLSHKHHMSPIFVSPSIPKEILVAKPTLPETKWKRCQLLLILGLVILLWENKTVCQSPSKQFISVTHTRGFRSALFTLLRSIPCPVWSFVSRNVWYSNGHRQQGGPADMRDDTTPRILRSRPGRAGRDMDLRCDLSKHRSRPRCLAWTSAAGSVCRSRR